MDEVALDRLVGACLHDLGPTVVGNSGRKDLVAAGLIEDPAHLGLEVAAVFQLILGLEAAVLVEEFVLFEGEFDRSESFNFSRAAPTVSDHAELVALEQVREHLRSLEDRVDLSELLEARVDQVEVVSEVGQAHDSVDLN